MNKINKILVVAVSGIVIAAGKPSGEGTVPAYKPGQCLQDYRFHEPWHPEPQTKLIVRSGNYHYLVVPWLADVKRYGEPEEILIAIGNQFKRTLCPARYPDANLPQR